MSGGKAGGDGGCQRGPQSAQSEPSGQLGLGDEPGAAPDDPGPPSSQMPSLLRSMPPESAQLLRQMAPGANGGRVGGDGG